MRALPYGPTAMLLDDLTVPPAALARTIRSIAMTGVIDVVPAARTVLVTCADRPALDAVTAVLARLEASSDERPGGRQPIEISVRYEGADLEQVADATGLTIEDVVERHASATYTVAFCGFAPGFAYLAGLDPRLWLPRRATPRTRVPAGSLAIAAEYSAIYPTASPGGWHLIGVTEAVMFDPSRTPAALLEPGDAVRFLPV